MSKKKILLIGCSQLLLRSQPWLCFVNNQPFDNPEREYPVGKIQDEVLEDDNFIIYNLSHPGAGNFYIKGRLLEFINNITIPDYTYLQFTGIKRIDLHLSKTYDTTIQEKKIPHSVRETDWFKWIISGGSTGSWLHQRWTQKLFLPYYFDSNKVQSINLSLACINDCVNLLSNLNLKFNWTTFYNYFSPPEKYMIDFDGQIDKWPSWLNQNGFLNSFPKNEKLIYRDWLETNRSKINL
jgi:hypothetical protein